MRNTSASEHACPSRRDLLALLAAAVPGAAVSQARAAPLTNTGTSSMTASSNPTLTARQVAIGPIAAATAVGDMPSLSAALHRGLDEGLSVSEAKEVLVRLYAYAGFPRALNALGELMKVLGDRRARGLVAAAGREAGPVPTGPELLAAGTANQTKLAGAPVKGPLFDFAPAIDTFLKTHLFGDIFARDVLDWQSRELATVAALAAMSGVEPQLLAHLRISLNTGLTTAQLLQLADVLIGHRHAEAGHRLAALVRQHLVPA